MDRAPFLPFALLGLLALAAVVAAETPLAEDGSGDVRMFVADQDAGAPPEGRMSQFDLVGLIATEATDNVRFTLQVAALDGQGAFVDDAAYYIHFTHNDQPFRLGIFVFETPEGKQQYSRLERQSAEDGEWDPMRWHEVDLDIAGGTLSVEVYREDLRDSQGAAPFPGRALSEVFARSATSLADGSFVRINGMEFGYPTDARDRMPDEGFSVQVLEFQEGLRQSGHAVLWTDRPMRASNGEASTFVFKVSAQNTGERQDTFELTTRELPTGWHVSLPDQVVTLAAGETKELPLILSTPFSHKHGSAEEFLVTMTSRSDPGSVGRARLGIYYHEIPQPAGHHDEVWFHSGRYWEGTLADVFQHLFTWGPRYAYFNTLEQDENDEGIAVPGYYQGYATRDGGSDPLSRWQWPVYLSPGLSMGLDFDIDRTGTFRVPLVIEEPFPQATVHGRLVHWAYDEEQGEYTNTDIAVFAPQGPTDLLPGTHVFEWEWTPTPEADLLPFADRQGLVFVVLFDTPVPHGFTAIEAPLLGPGGHARLPLLEYRDPVQEQYETQTYLHFTAPTAAMANPGTTRILEGSLHNADTDAFPYAIHIEGVNADWARLLVPERGSLAPDGTLLIRIAVDVPSDALDGEAADVVVSVASREDPTVRALGRFFVGVDTDKEHQDDAADAVEGPADVDSPAPVLAPLVLAAAVLLRRRRA